ncbi:bifunctional 2',3'-cyclic-nucleotide 2'-phosphodiesterase/3'-nucleotidase [Metabacillus malikii]|uniref:2',3'-cyclic-nucleotide 2'-phosphodiesterase/3'-nucleotidase/5'-nucleotidase n=1 Tax=Metabacillus malikii TaxID=1504265 RepID=A0ABT9ZBC2_9BACI|nr:bifunctional 2',3'-cyclic-nucleotide 2'-phosphodiesterase/3'-nucleotidase [Metabacillus malikii]MDQ0229559.1 2',3'-cyclic-nucleotide 2'-phosphodiesterase/3'-nucleotidase/5'-nucleotidase [Metabacillus malikii]
MRRRIRRNLKRKMLYSTFATALVVSIMPFQSFATTNAKATEPVKMDVRLLETTDIHAHIMDYDYYGDKTNSNFGLVRTATLLKQRQAEKENTLLVDNGDLIQGNPFGEYVFKNGLRDGEVHPIIAALNLLNYDAATLGNHEFNYGLDFLDETMDDANFPVVNANVFHANNETDYYYKPYEIVEKDFVDSNGDIHKVKVGFTGFVTPQINVWDKKHLDGKVVTKDIVESAKRVIPEMKENGADLVVVIAHSGVNTSEGVAGAENAVFDLTKQVADIDVVVSGHQHNTFPGDARFNGVAEIDNVKGTVNGIPVVMPKNWGSHLGIIDLELQLLDEEWEVVDSQATAEPITAVSERDNEMVEVVKKAHNSTLEYVRQSVGSTTAPINSFFSLVQDDPSIQIVTDAQKWYVEEKLKGTEYEGMPLLSVGAPFKAGGRNGADYYTNIPKGNLAIKNVGDLYLYDNTIQVVKITGADVKDWLEMSAGQFNQIDPSQTMEQNLINNEFPTFNFDVIDGITYQIDVTKPAKYDTSGNLVNKDSSRIKNIMYEGNPIDLNKEFLVVTNNYRASGGGNFPGDLPSKIIAQYPDENRQAVMNYIIEKGEVNPSADQNWSIAPIYGDVTVTFESSPSAKAFAEEAEQINFVEDLDTGFSKYSLNLSSNEWDLKIMHTNDTHAHLDNVARRVTAVEEARASVENSILLDAGDVFSGTLYFNQYLGQADLEFMNKMKYDAMVPGNHEFDKGPSVFADFIKNAKFPIVSSNIDYSTEALLSPLFKNEIGSSKNGGAIYPASIIEVNGEDIGVLGLTTEDTTLLSNPGANLVFEDYIEKAKMTVERLESEGINKIIALTHLGFHYDKKLAEQVDGIDVIVGGHSHTLLTEPVVIDEDSEPTIVLSAHEYGNYLGNADVTFDKDGVLTSWKQQLIDINAKDENDKYVISEDADTANRLAELAAPIEELKQQIVGKTEVFLNGERNDVRTKETNLGNLITDGMLWRAQKQNTGATIAIQNGGGIRASIEKGDISLGDVLTVLPFANTLVTLDLTGQEIIDALENGVSQVEDGAGRFPQVSGMKFGFDPEKPAGNRVHSVFVQTESGYEKINVNKMYTVATNAFIADGGDGYESFKAAKDDGRLTELFIPDFDVFQEYLQEIGTVTITEENRITIGVAPAESPEKPGNDAGETPVNDTPNVDDKTNDKPATEQQKNTTPEESNTFGNKNNVKFGQSLPNTATNVFNLIVIGAVVIIGGIALYLINRKRKQAQA